MRRIIPQLALHHLVVPKVITTHHKITLPSIRARLVQCSTATTLKISVALSGDSVVTTSNLEEVAFEAEGIFKTYIGTPTAKVVREGVNTQRMAHPNTAHRMALRHILLSRHHNKVAQLKLRLKTEKMTTILSDHQRIFKSRTRRRRSTIRRPCHHPADLLLLDHSPTNSALHSKPLQKRQWRHPNPRFLKSSTLVQSDVNHMVLVEAMIEVTHPHVPFLQNLLHQDLVQTRDNIVRLNLLQCGRSRRL
jgi:hypothetical protein